VIKSFSESISAGSQDPYITTKGVSRMKERKSPFQALKANQIPLTKEERAVVMKHKAVWRFGGHGKATPAVWKSKDSHGKIIYVTHTHRAYNTAPTLLGAISRFHKFIKSTA